jgi:hypothetical protein
MHLRHLCSAAHVEIYFDTFNNWLFIDWEGNLTLDVVQHACLEIARCYLQHPFPRVLNSNVQVTNITPDVAAWLANEFTATLSLAGVEQLAWVVAPTLRARGEALEAIYRLAHNAVHMFEYLEEAVTWLQQTAVLPESGAATLPQPRQDEQLNQWVAALAQQLHEQDAAAVGVLGYARDGVLP